ncbi:MAG: prepilin-type N-terminal cleavage/methylation domain-containing protein [Bdellovibrionia bacterium]
MIVNIKREFSNVKQNIDKTKNVYANESGFSMIEIMVAFGLAAILLLGITTTTTLTHNNTSNMHGVLYRDELVRQVQQLSSTPQTLQKTLAYSANTSLRACVQPPGTAGANPGCTHLTEYPVVLTDIAGSAVTGPAAIPITDESLSGTPLFYSVMDGSLCRNGAVPVTSPDSRCALEVVTSFVPTCTDASNYCQDPKKISITFQYRVRLATIASGPKPLGGAQLKSIIAPPAPLSYVNAMSIQSGFFTN